MSADGRRLVPCYFAYAPGFRDGVALERDNGWYVCAMSRATGALKEARRAGPFKTEREATQVAAAMSAARAP